VIGKLSKKEKQARKSGVGEKQTEKWKGGVQLTRFAGCATAERQSSAKNH